MATKNIGMRVDPEVARVYSEMAATLTQGFKDLRLPGGEITASGLMRDVLTGGAVTYGRILEQYDTPADVVRALQALTPEPVAGEVGA